MQGKETGGVKLKGKPTLLNDGTQLRATRKRGNIEELRKVL